MLAIHVVLTKLVVLSGVVTITEGVSGWFIKIVVHTPGVC
jgi:hypothetical protein